MSLQQFTNNANTTLSAAIPSAVATSCVVVSSTEFPVLAAGNWFIATIATVVGGVVTASEIVKVTAVSGTTWTIARGQEGSTAQPWAAGSLVALLPTAGGLGNFLQQTPQTAAEVAASVTPTNTNYPELNVLRYGADPTATTDSTAAINQAIAVAVQKAKWSAHSSLTFNARVYIPTGWYLVGSTGTYVSYGAEPVIIAGDGPQASVIINGSTNQPAIACNGGSGGQFYGGFKDIGFGQQSGVTAVAGNCALALTHYNEFFIDNVTVYNYPNPPYNGIVLTYCQQFVVSNVESQGALNYGISITESGAGQGCSYGAFTNCHADDCAYGWQMGQAHDMAFTNCGAIYSSTSGWLLQSASPSTAPNLNCRFVSCASDSSGSHNWNISDAVGCTWASCWGSSQKGGGSSTGTGFLIQTVNSHSLSFTDCVAANNNGDGFKVLDTGSSAPTFLYFTNCHSGYQGLGNGQGGTGFGYNISATCHSIRITSGEVQGNVSPGGINFNGANTGTQDIIYRDVYGYQNSDQGVESVSGASSVTVTHLANLNPVSPDCVTITPNSSMAASGISCYWISSVGIASFTLSFNTTINSTPFVFSWRVDSNNT